jgi:hypothetical protein
MATMTLWYTLCCTLALTKITTTVPHVNFSDKYSVYDGITFPQVPPSSYFQKIKEFLYRESEKNLHIPSHDLAQSECLQVYLSRYEEFLKNMEFSAIYAPNFLECVNGINHIFQQLHIEKLYQSPSGSFGLLAHELPKV